MEYIYDKKLYSNGIIIAQMAELTTRSIKKLALRKDLGGFSTFCIKEAKKKALKDILESEEIKNILEYKNIKYEMRYWKRKYLIFNFYIGSIEHEVGYIISKLEF